MLTLGLQQWLKERLENEQGISIKSEGVLQQGCNWLQTSFKNNGMGEWGQKFWCLKNAIFRCQVEMENSYNFHIPIDKHSTLLLNSNKWAIAQLVFMLHLWYFWSYLLICCNEHKNNFFFIWKKNAWPMSINFKVMSINITFGIA